MTKSEYQQLVQFIAPKFDEIRQQFGDIRREFGQRFDGIETRLTKVETYSEENRQLIETVAEGVAGLRTEVHTGFASLRVEMREGFQLQGRTIQDLDTRVGSLEARTA